MEFPRQEFLTPDDEQLLGGIRHLLTGSRDWSRSRPRQLNAEKFRDEIRRNRQVRGWINAGNIWLDGRVTVRDPYGTTDLRLHACDKLYNPGGEYCEVLGHFACNECWRMTQKKCAEADLPSVNYDPMAADRPLTASWKVINDRNRALRQQAISGYDHDDIASSEGSRSRLGSSKLEKILNETHISETLMEEKRKSIFITEPQEEVKVEETEPERERFVFKNDLDLMCPPLLSIYQSRAGAESETCLVEPE